jgi:RNA polymerase sigma-70 factor (ECF subfamily)
LIHNASGASPIAAAKRGAGSTGVGQVPSSIGTGSASAGTAGDYPAGTAALVTDLRATVVAMTAAPHARDDEQALLRRAADGDERAFRELVEPYRAQLRAHCYRMLGSLHDADDALQDAMLRAWRGMAGFEGRGSVRSWLYSIATNAAVDITRHRSRRELPVNFGPAAGPGGRVAEPVADPVWLEPYPDRWLTSDVGSSPEARYEQRESVELAFLVVLQRLPPRQRAVLILRDVMGFSAMEISSQLGTSVPSVNSALQRARASAHRDLPARSQQSVLRDLGDQRTRALVRQYSDAIERGDTDTLISMLTEDATWSMPPAPTWFQGLASIREWLVRDPLPQRWKHQPAWSNGQLAVGCYIFDQDKGSYLPAVIDVLTLAGEKISAVTAFLTVGAAGVPRDGGPESGEEFFARFGLPAKLT